MYYRVVSNKNSQHVHSLEIEKICNLFINTIIIVNETLKDQHVNLYVLSIPCKLLMNNHLIKRGIIACNIFINFFD